jgi:hypothetical protein
MTEDFATGRFICLQTSSRSGLPCQHFVNGTSPTASM